MENVNEGTGTGGLQVDPALRDFVADELVAGLDLEPERFWSIVAELNDRFAGRVGDLPMFHPVELLDASIRGVDPVAASTERRGRTRLDARTAEPGTF